MTFFLYAGFSTWIKYNLIQLKLSHMELMFSEKCEKFRVFQGRLEASTIECLGVMDQIWPKGCKLEFLILPAAPMEPGRSSSSRRVIKTSVSHFPNLEHSIGPEYAAIIISYNVDNKTQFLSLKCCFLWLKPSKAT